MARPVGHLPQHRLLRRGVRGGADDGRHGRLRQGLERRVVQARRDGDAAADGVDVAVGRKTSAAPPAHEAALEQIADGPDPETVEDLLAQPPPPPRAVEAHVENAAGPVPAGDEQRPAVVADLQPRVAVLDERGGPRLGRRRRVRPVHAGQGGGDAGAGAGIVVEAEQGMLRAVGRDVHRPRAGVGPVEEARLAGAVAQPDGEQVAQAARLVRGQEPGGVLRPGDPEEAARVLADEPLQQVGPRLVEARRVGVEQGDHVVGKEVLGLRREPFNDRVPILPHVQVERLEPARYVDGLVAEKEGADEPKVPRGRARDEQHAGPLADHPHGRRLLVVRAEQFVRPGLDADRVDEAALGGRLVPERDGRLLRLGVEGDGPAVDDPLGGLGAVVRDAPLDELDPDGGAVEPLGLDAGLDGERVAAEDGLRGPDLGGAEVLRRSGVAHADGQDGHAAAGGGVGGGAGVGPARVLPVRDEDDAGERAPGRRVERLADRAGQVGGRPGRRQRRDGRILGHTGGLVGRFLPFGQDGLGVQPDGVAQAHAVGEGHDADAADGLEPPEKARVVAAEEGVDDLGPGGVLGGEGVGRPAGDGGKTLRARVVVAVAEAHREGIVQQQDDVRFEAAAERDGQGRAHQDQGQDEDAGDADGGEEHPHGARACAALPPVQPPHEVEGGGGQEDGRDGRPRRRSVGPDELRLRPLGDAGRVEAEDVEPDVAHSSCLPLPKPRGCHGGPCPAVRVRGGTHGRTRPAVAPAVSDAAAS